MKPKTHLYLLGGSSAYTTYADDFVTASGQENARIAVLVQTRVGWQKHKTEIVEPWLQRGVTQYELVVPNEQGVLDTEKAISILKNATGIFIGGGYTPTYHRLFATEPIRAIIREQYKKGVPVAGVSAGALIAMEKCRLKCDEIGSESLEIVAGLNLVKGFIIGVHFTERDALPEVLEIMKATQTQVGIGLDETACIVCENGEIVRVLGKSVHRLVMTDFESATYEETVL